MGKENGLMRLDLCLMAATEGRAYLRHEGGCVVWLKGKRSPHYFSPERPRRPSSAILDS